MPYADHWLLERWSEFSDREAIVYADRATGYRQLRAKSDEWLAVLHAKGVAQGDVVAMRGDYTPDTCALFVALAFAGAVVVPLPAGEEPKHYLDAVQAKAFFDFSASGEWTFSPFAPGEPPPLLRGL